MTRRRDLVRHLQGLGEIRDIMSSMRTLAFMETRKLARFLDAQQAVVESIETVADDFLDFYAPDLPESGETLPVYLLIGTERGFCGNLNQALIDHLQSAIDAQNSATPLVLAVGSKLHTLMNGATRAAAFIRGASVAEEVTVVLNQMVKELSSLQQRNAMLTVYALYHGGDNGVAMRKLLPPFQIRQQRPRRFTHPPLLQLSPSRFFVELSEHYLFAALHAMLYSSLMAENLNRMSHLENAVNHLDDKSEQLSRRLSAMRQEEIIEEIEVILLNSGSLDKS